MNIIWITTKMITPLELVTRAMKEEISPFIIN